MPIPDFDQYGLLPEGIHNCTIADMAARLCWTDRRWAMLANFVTCLEVEIRPLVHEPIIVDGSFVTKEKEPNDIDIAIDLISLTSSRRQAIDEALRPIVFVLQTLYKVDLQLNTSGLAQDYIELFQRVKGEKIKERKIPEHIKKGMLRLS